MSIATLSTLEEANFTVEQARALTRVLEEDHHNLATKDDINSLKMATKDDINSLRMATKNDINSFKMATKNDIRFLEATMATKEETQFIREEIKDIRGDIKAIEAKMVTKADLNKINNNMVKWIVVGMFFNIGTLVVLIKYLFL